MTTALVTGSEGFAGRHLTSVLEGAGWLVFRLSHRPSLEANNRFFQADITDEHRVMALVGDLKPDVVFHLAAPGRAADAETVLGTIVSGTTAVCRALRRAGRRTRLVVAGSSAQYGRASGWFDQLTEDDPCLPVTVYGHAKAAAEAIAFALAESAPYELLAARPFNHIGPGESDSTVAGAIASRIRRYLVGEADSIEVANLSAVRDFTDVRDVAHGYLALAERGVPGSVYNVCSGRRTSIQQVLDGLLAEAGLDHSTVRVIPGASGIQSQCGSPDRTRAQTAWEATIPLASSLRDLLADSSRRSRSPVGDRC